MTCSSSVAAIFGGSQPKLFCEDHNGEEIKRYCKTDSTFVCLECIIECHTGHNIIRISELAASKKDEIIELINQVKKNYLAELKTRINDSKNAKRIHKQCVSECTKVMRKRASDLNNQLNKLKNETISELKEVQKCEIERQDDIERYLSNEEKGLNSLTKSIEKAMQNNNHEQMIHLSISLENALFKLQQTPPTNIEAMEFYAYEEVQERIEELFGQCKVRELYVELSDDENEAKIVNVEKQVHIREAYKLTDDPIACLTPTLRGSVWFGVKGEKKITQTSKGEAMKSENIESNVIDFAISKESDIIVVMKKRTRLLRIRPNGQKLDFIDAKPLYPNGIHVTDDGFTYISVIDNESMDSSSESKRAVIKYSSTGTGLQKFAKDDKGDPFFILPRKLVVTHSQDICVIDSTSLFSGRIVGVSSSGALKYTYSGREDLEMQTFNPTAVKCDSHGRAIVADFDNCLLHLLNHNGELIYLINSNSPEGIYGPCSLGIDGADQIWIGSYDGYITRIDALDPPRKKGRVDKPLPKLVKDGTSLSIKQTAETYMNPSVGKNLRSKSAMKPGNKLEKQDSMKLDQGRTRSAIANTLKRENSLAITKKDEKSKTEQKVTFETKMVSNESGKTNITRKEHNQTDVTTRQTQDGSKDTKTQDGSKDTKTEDVSKDTKTQDGSKDTKTQDGSKDTKTLDVSKDTKTQDSSKDTKTQDVSKDTKTQTSSNNKPNQTTGDKKPETINENKTDQRIEKTLDQKSQNVVEKAKEQTIQNKTDQTANNKTVPNKISDKNIAQSSNKANPKDEQSNTSNQNTGSPNPVANDKPQPATGNGNKGSDKKDEKSKTTNSSAEKENTKVESGAKDKSKGNESTKEKRKEKGETVKSKDPAKQETKIVTKNVANNTDKKQLDTISESKIAEKSTGKETFKSSETSVEKGQKDMLDKTKPSKHTKKNPATETKVSNQEPTKDGRPHQKNKALTEKVLEKTKDNTIKADETTSDNGIQKEKGIEKSKLESIKDKKTDVNTTDLKAKSQTTKTQTKSKDEDSKKKDSNTIIQKPTIMKRRNENAPSKESNDSEDNEKKTNRLPWKEAKNKVTENKKKTDTVPEHGSNIKEDKNDKKEKGMNADTKASEQSVGPPLVEKSKGAAKSEVEQRKREEKKKEMQIKDDSLKGKKSPLASSSDNAITTVNKGNTSSRRNSNSSIISNKMTKKSEEKVEELKKIYDKPKSAKSKQSIAGNEKVNKTPSKPQANSDNNKNASATINTAGQNVAETPKPNQSATKDETTKVSNPKPATKEEAKVHNPKQPATKDETKVPKPTQPTTKDETKVSNPKPNKSGK